MQKISVIVPVWNVEKYIHKCVDSIINQSYENLEIILVDDGSPDNCPAICDEYAEKDSRIKVIHKENGGLSSARNAGLDIATGDYIGFVDSDDFIHRDFYKILLEECEKNDVDTACISYKDIFEEETADKTDKNSFEIDEITNKSIDKYETKIYNQNELWNKLYINNYKTESTFIIKSIIVCNKIYKKNIFNEIRFMNGFIHEDNIIHTDILVKINNMIYIDLPLYYYNKSNSNSITTKNKSNREMKKYYEDILFNYCICKNLKKAKINNNDRKFLVKKCLFLILFRFSKIINNKKYDKNKINESIYYLNNIYEKFSDLYSYNLILKYLMHLYIKKKYKLLMILCVILRSLHFEKIKCDSSCL